MEENINVSSNKNNDLVKYVLIGVIALIVILIGVVAIKIVKASSSKNLGTWECANANRKAHIYITKKDSFRLEIDNYGSPIVTNVKVKKEKDASSDKKRDGYNYTKYKIVSGYKSSGGSKTEITEEDNKTFIFGTKKSGEAHYVSEDKNGVVEFECQKK